MEGGKVKEMALYSILILIYKVFHKNHHNPLRVSELFCGTEYRLTQDKIHMWQLKIEYRINKINTAERN